MTVYAPTNTLILTDTGSNVRVTVTGPDGAQQTLEADKVLQAIGFKPRTEGYGLENTGVKLTDLSLCLPDFVMESLREAIPVFGRQIAGYDHPDVVLTGVEARTSSPVRFTRGADFQSLNVKGLYPAGEGAGYAGGRGKHEPPC